MEKRAQDREPYERPQVVRVVLAADEMAVVGCKMPTQRDGPTLGCVYTQCRNPGS